MRRHALHDEQSKKRIATADAALVLRGVSDI